MYNRKRAREKKFWLAKNTSIYPKLMQRSEIASAKR